MVLNRLNYSLRSTTILWLIKWIGLKSKIIIPGASLLSKGAKLIINHIYCWESCWGQIAIISSLGRWSKVQRAIQNYTIFCRNFFPHKHPNSIKWDKRKSSIQQSRTHCTLSSYTTILLFFCQHHINCILTMGRLRGKNPYSCGLKFFTFKWQQCSHPMHFFINNALNNSRAPLQKLSLSLEPAKLSNLRQNKGHLLFYT